MTPFAIGLSGIGLMLAMLFLRQPVWLALAVIGVGGNLLLNSVMSAKFLAGTTIFDVASNYNLSVIPLFILMGEIATGSRMSAERLLINCWRSGAGGSRVLRRRQPLLELAPHFESLFVRFSGLVEATDDASGRVGRIVPITEQGALDKAPGSRNIVRKLIGTGNKVRTTHTTTGPERIAGIGPRTRPVWLRTVINRNRSVRAVVNRHRARKSHTHTAVIKCIEIDL